VVTKGNAETKTKGKERGKEKHDGCVQFGHVSGLTYNNRISVPANLADIKLAITFIKNTLKKQPRKSFYVGKGSYTLVPKTTKFETNAAKENRLAAMTNRVDKNKAEILFSHSVKPTYMDVVYDVMIAPNGNANQYDRQHSTIQAMLIHLFCGPQFAPANCLMGKTGAKTTGDNWVYPGLGFGPGLSSRKPSKLDKILADAGLSKKLSEYKLAEA